MTGWRKVSIAAAVALLVASCGAADDADDAGTEAPQPTVSAPGNQDTSSPPPTSAAPDRTDRETDKLPERVPTDPGGKTVTGEVPAEYLAPVVADAAQRAGVDPSDANVVTAQQMEWPDGSLGCPEPGMMYTQAIVNGYWVVIEAGGAGFDYRLTDKGMFRLCTTPLGGPGGTAPNS